MAESPNEATEQRSISWMLAAALAVLALVAGVWLGRVAFVENETPSPRILDIEVVDDDLEVSGSVEYVENHEVYILTINTMPPPPEGEVFQVWVQIDDIVVPAGLLNPDSRTFAFSAFSGRYDTMFITVEQGSSGSALPTSDPVITVDLTEL